MVVNLEVRELEKNDEKAWDEYVLNSDTSTFFHQIGWKNVIEKTYGHEPHYLIAEEDGDIKGILPIFFLNSRIFGEKFVSVPFGPYGGMCVDDHVAEYALIKRAKKIVKEKDANYLEIRSLSDNGSRLITNDAYVTLILSLESNSDLIWDKFSKKVRNATRKAINSGVEIKMGNNHCRNFFHMYSINMRNLGAPVHAYSFFANLLSEFPEQTEISVIMYEGKVIAGAFLLDFKDTIISGWASSDKSYKNFNPNNLLYWEIIKKGCQEGYKYFDFGRSIADSGTYRFKKPWGAEVTQLHYQYYLNRTKKIPDTSQINNKRKMFAKIWRRMPVLLTERIGPLLRGNFP